MGGNNRDRDWKNVKLTNYFYVCDVVTKAGTQIVSQTLTDPSYIKKPLVAGTNRLNQAK